MDGKSMKWVPLGPLRMGRNTATFTSLTYWMVSHANDKSITPRSNTPIASSTHDALVYINLSYLTPPMECMRLLSLFCLGLCQSLRKFYGEED